MQPRSAGTCGTSSNTSNGTFQTGRGPWPWPWQCPWPWPRLGVAVPVAVQKSHQQKNQRNSHSSNGSPLPRERSPPTSGAERCTHQAALVASPLSRLARHHSAVPTGHMAAAAGAGVGQSSRPQVQDNARAPLALAPARRSPLPAGCRHAPGSQRAGPRTGTAHPLPGPAAPALGRRVAQPLGVAEGIMLHRGEAVSTHPALPLT